jgi:hypothetical protein
VRAGKGRNGEEREGWHGCWYEFYDDSTIPLFFFFSFFLFFFLLILVHGFFFLSGSPFLCVLSIFPFSL